jgi:hypothetical protein
LTFAFRDGLNPLEKALFSANWSEGVKQTYQLPDAGGQMSDAGNKMSGG